MTLVIAWRDKYNIYMAGDSAVTKRNISVLEKDTYGKSPRKNTTFNELNIFTEDLLITESVIKIHNIESKIIIGYAGFGNSAIDVVNHIKENYTKNSIENLIYEGSILFGNRFAMIAGLFRDEKPTLISYNVNGDYAITSDGDAVAIGNQDETLTSLARTGLDFLVSMKITPDKFLLLFCCMMQNAIIRGNYIKKRNWWCIYWSLYVKKQL